MNMVKKSKRLCANIRAYNSITIVIILLDLYYLLMIMLQNLPSFIFMMLQTRFQIGCHSFHIQTLLRHWMRL
uniref:Uncharacterized protein n=1 Tax=Salix viminalis TaxID=40686 RepID=A0A6N2KEA5_SALVM